MSTQSRWLFDAPVAHERVYSSNPSTQQAYYGHPELGTEVEWELQEGRHSTAIPPAGTGQIDLIRQETQPPASTLYVNIPLGSESPARPMTGIFVPQNYRIQPQVDLILYLHGHKPGKLPGLTIDRYWNRECMPFWPLREGVNAGSKNAILVAPTLGLKSQVGRLLSAGGFDAYLNKVMAALVRYGPYRGRSPGVGNIILACHSGGGYPMRSLASSNQHYTSHIRECWGFDCLYNKGDETLWAQWARARPGARLYIYYLHTTAGRSQRLQSQNVPNVFVRRSIARAHDWVPITHWQTRIQNTPFLQNR